MAKKIDAKELKEMAKALNKLELTEPIALKTDVDEMTEDFISSIEEIDDDGKIDEVSKKIISYYEKVLELTDSDSDDDDDEKPKSKKAKEEDSDDDDDEKPKSKKSRKTKDDDDDDEKPKSKKAKEEDVKDNTELIEDLEDIDDLDDLVEFVENNKIDIEIDEDGKLKKEKAKVLQKLEEKPKAKAKKGKDDDSDDDEKPKKSSGRGFEKKKAGTTVRDVLKKAFGEVNKKGFTEKEVADLAIGFRKELGEQPSGNTIKAHIKSIVGVMMEMELITEKNGKLKVA